MNFFPALSYFMTMRNITLLSAAFLFTPLAAVWAEEPKSSNDAAWLQKRGELLFADTFDRDETGNGLRGVGNGWESATADRVPQIKQADLDDGILKISSATKEVGHGIHLHHDAGLADGGVTLRFKFPGLNAGESLTVGFVDRQLPGVHAGHLCYAKLNPTSITLIDQKTGVSEEKIRKQRQAYLDRKEKLPPELDTLLKSKEKTVPWKADREWHELVLAAEGEELRLSLDGKLVCAHRSAGFAHPEKRWLSLAAPNTVWVDDIKIWKVPAK